ncbi:MAG: prepilin-type N-terminal cleavage/methylation domain-containing protein [Opitutaceae bacterium]|nr:prepilin-type N-terminal cleavage/methylation domain-containing protein [Opitutaceae bacterium]
MPTSPQCCVFFNHAGDRLAKASGEQARPHRRTAGLTLVEVMVALLLMASVMVGFITAFIQSRRVTESSVLHAAATSIVYGIIEQIKQLDYTSLLPNYEVDPFAPVAKTPPYVRVRINQSTVVWLKVVHTAAPGAPQAPTVTPAPTATAASVGAIQNFIGSLPLSTVTGTTSQEINLDLWVWIDEIPDAANNVSEVKKITVVYTYSYIDGRATRTIRDREVFLRTRFDQ